MIRLRSLGESVIQVRDIRVGPESEVLFGALLYLLVARGRQIPRSVLIELFWPGPDENASRHCARQLLYRLRQIGVPLEGDNGSVAISLPNAELDYEALLAADEPDAVMGRSAIVFLPGYAPRLSPRFDEWLEEHREHVHGRLRKTLLRRVKEARSEARWSDVEMLARQCLSCDPLNEEATLALAEATALGGGKAQALAIIDRYLRELGPDSRDIRIPATVLRRRIVDQLPGPALSGTTETQFVGRDASVAMLNELLRSARSSVGRACVIEGVAGIGKSRLAAEVSAAAALQGVNVRRVICQESDRERPLSAFADLVPTLLSLRGAAGCSPESLGFLRRLTEHDAKATQPSESAREAEFLAAQIRQSLFDLMDAVAAERTLMLVVENAHRLDPTSWKVFREMFEWVRTRQVLVVLTMREVPAGVLGESALDGTVLRHRLGPLSDADASTVFTTFIERHGTAVLEAHRAWCVRIAEGSPFYLRELASHWLTTRETESLPPSLSALIDARLSSISAKAMRVLQACVGFGKNASLSRIARALEYPRYELIDALEELERGGFIVAAGSGISCRHDILSDAAAARLTTSAQRLLHHTIGVILEDDAETTQSTGLLWDCARHWYLAGDSSRALTLARRCADHLLDLGLAREADAILSEAIEYCRFPEDEIPLLALRSRALHQMAQWNSLASVVGRLEVLRSATTPVSPGHCAEEFMLLEAQWKLSVDLRLLLTQSMRCVDDVAASAEHRLEAAGWAMVFTDNLCEPAIAASLYKQARQLRSHGNSNLLSSRRVELIYHTSYGSLDEAVTLARRAMEAEKGSSDLSRRMHALRNGSVTLRQAGFVMEATTALQAAFDLAERHGIPASAYSAADMLCALHLDEGDYARARRWYDSAQGWIDRVQSPEHALCNSAREGARLAIHDGHFDEALTLIDYALRNPQTLGLPRMTAYHMALRLLVQCQTGTPDAGLLAQLEESHFRMRAAGYQDLIVAAIVAATARLGDIPKAMITLEVYTSQHRRERSALSAELQAARKLVLEQRRS